MANALVTRWVRAFGLAGLALALMAFGARAAAADEAGASLLGMSLAEAQRTDFFGFFHLVETGRDSDERGRTVATFRPESEAMSRIAAVGATLDGEGRIVGMSLSLARSFIDGRERIFARDIAKSFLLDATPAADRAAVEPLAEEIWLGEAKAKAASKGFLTFLGREASERLDLTRSALSLDNATQDGEPWLVMRMQLLE